MSPPSGPEGPYAYYAFISYNHRDERAARWLQRRLEHYRLPAVSRKELGGDLRPRPVFRYAVNLPLGELRTQIKAELEASKYLLVVCSPNSARPNVRGEHWVDDEIRHFIELGRADRIVPVIVDGEPNAGGDRECFPPALRGKTEIGGADLFRGSRTDRRNAFLKIVAKLLGILPDQLIRHAEEEERRIRRAKWLKLLPAALLAAVAACFALDANCTVAARYADWVDSFGLPQGIFPLRKSETARRHIHYRFEYRGFQRGPSPHADSAPWTPWNLFGLRRRLVRVVQANSAGVPVRRNHTEYAGRPPIQQFDYDAGNRLREIRCGRPSPSPDGLLLERRVEFWNEGSATNGLARFFSGESQLATAYAPASRAEADFSAPAQVGPPAPRSEIAQHALQRDAAGRTVRCLFLDVSGNNVADADGVYGFAFEHDDLGRPTARWSLFREGDGFVRRADRKGVAGRRYEYAGPNLRKTECVDPDGRPVTGPHGWMVAVDSFDDAGNNTESRYFDERGRPALCTDGYAGYRADYDSRGFMTNWTAFGLDGHPATTVEGIAGFRISCDGLGNRTNIVCTGTDGLPALNREGVAGLRMEYDPAGNVTCKAFHGPDGAPILSAGGTAGFLDAYDADGRLVEETALGLDGNPALSKDGVAITRIQWDARGNQTNMSFFGPDGTPILNKVGNAGWTAAYDARGNRTRQSFFGTDGNPILLKDGSAGWIARHDARGNRTNLFWLGTDGRPATIRDGTAGVRAEYDDHGRQTLAVWLGPDGRPVLDSDGTAGWRKAYDRHGNPTNVFWFGLDGNPVLLSDGTAGQRIRYDSRGNKTEVVYFGTDGLPALHEAGNAGWRAEYDSRGNMTATFSLGTDGKPLATEDGCTEIRFEYDRSGNLLSKRYLDPAGNPVAGRDGIAEERREYDGRGNETLWMACGADGRPTLARDKGYASVRRTYDALGRVTDIAYFDPLGNPAPGEEGPARVHFEYDARGNNVRQLSFGMDGRPFPSTADCCADLRKEYDSRGNCTREERFGPDGQPAPAPGGIAVCTMEYDAWDNVVRFRFFGADGSPVLLPDIGCAEIRRECDPMGNVLRERYFDADGRPVAAKERIFSEIRMEYDPRGNTTLRAYFDPDGNPVADPLNGHASVRCEYDAAGHQTLEAWFGPDGLPVADANGIASIRRQFDSRGHCTEKAFFGPDGLPATGIATVRNRYDERGHLVEEAFYGPDGLPAASEDGFARRAFSRNRLGQCLAVRLFDAAGNAIDPRSRPVMFAAEIRPGSHAAAAGIREGDIFCRIGSFDFLETTDMQLMHEAIQSAQSAEKELVMARKVADCCELVSFHLPPGLMGIRYSIVGLAADDALLQAWSEFRARPAPEP